METSPDAEYKLEGLGLMCTNTMRRANECQCCDQDNSKFPGFTWLAAAQGVSFRYPEFVITSLEQWWMTFLDHLLSRFHLEGVKMMMVPRPPKGTELALLKHIIAQERAALLTWIYVDGERQHISAEDLETAIKADFGQCSLFGLQPKVWRKSENTQLWEYINQKLKPAFPMVSIDDFIELASGAEDNAIVMVV